MRAPSAARLGDGEPIGAVRLASRLRMPRGPRAPSWTLFADIASVVGGATSDLLYEHPPRRIVGGRPSQSGVAPARGQSGDRARGTLSDRPPAVRRGDPRPRRR